MQDTSEKELLIKVSKYPLTYLLILAGRDWGQEEKGTTEDEMAGWHH